MAASAADELYNRGTERLAAQDYDAAIAALRDAVRLEPGASDIRLNLASALQCDGAGVDAVAAEVDAALAADADVRLRRATRKGRFAPERAWFSEDGGGARDAVLRLGAVLRSGGYGRESARAALARAAEGDEAAARLPAYASGTAWHDLRLGLGAATLRGLDPLVGCFLVGVAVDAPALASRLGDLDALLEMGLLHRVGDAVASGVQLFPLDDAVVVATDWSSETLLDATRAVMPVGVESLELALLYGPDDAGDVLDLCCGSGVQGLARRARTGATFVDVNDRALAFAALNGVLNGGAPRDAVVRADVRSQIPGLGTFDVVLVNPPFVVGGTALFADGGDDGNAVLGPLLAHGAALLRRGAVMMVASEFANIERWSGLIPDVFDSLLFFDPAHLETSADYARGRCPTALEAAALEARMKDAGVESMCSGYLVLRLAEEAPPRRFLRELPPASSPDEGYLEREAVSEEIRDATAAFHRRRGRYL